METKRIAVIGTGMIGCSFALAAKKAFPGIVIAGADASAGNLVEAWSAGLIDEAGTIEDVSRHADIILICTPVNTISKLVITALENSGRHAVVMDAGSVKKPVCDAVTDHPDRKRFVAAHPIAGTENHGPRAAVECLFESKICFICDQERSSPESAGRAQDFFERIGMQIIRSDSGSHDHHMANLSHLSHMIAYGLALASLECESPENILSMSGSGFASTVRLAKSHSSMWLPIFSMNRGQVLSAMDRFMTKMEQLRMALRTEDSVALDSMIRRSNTLRNILDKKPSLKTAV